MRSKAISAAVLASIAGNPVNISLHLNASAFIPSSPHMLGKVKLTVWDLSFIVTEACEGPSSRIVEWHVSPGRPPLRPCPVQSRTCLSLGWRRESTQVRDAWMQSGGGNVMTSHLVDGDGEVGRRGLADVVGAAPC